MDAFELLDLPRRPWLDPAAVRAAFQARSRDLHPDAERGDADAFARLNAANRALERPASRLRLLAGDLEIPALPPDVALGFEIGAALRECDAGLARRRTAGGALARALLAGELERSRVALAALSSRVDRHVAAGETRLRACDAAWPDVAPADLAALAGEFTFLERWSTQLRERELELRIEMGGDKAPPSVAFPSVPADGHRRPA